ncbi:MAG: ATP-binding protein [Desulfomonilaceae bacterium]
MEAIGTLACRVAHDFNNVLQVVLGFSDMLLWGESLPETRKKYIRMISDAARRGAELVKGLMAFRRKVDFKPQPLNLNHRLIDFCKMLERAIPKTIGIELLLADDLASVNADPIQIDQILMNLSVNARDAMPRRGQLTFRTSNSILGEQYVSKHIESKAGPHVLVTVSDTGSGMDSRTLERIFEPFYTTKEAGKGTGLGLAMGHGIVKQHGGHVTCGSQPGKGTTFRIYLPAMVPKTTEDEIIARPEPKGGTETILVVDNEEVVRQVSVRVLARSGYKVIEAFDGKEAISIFKEKKETDLVLLDLMMPEMDGKQCLDALLAIDPSVKVVIASGYLADGSID